MSHILRAGICGSGVVPGSIASATASPPRRLLVQHGGSQGRPNPFQGRLLVIFDGTVSQ
jgi:hypothetical protein